MISSRICRWLPLALMPCLVSCNAIFAFSNWLGSNYEHIGSICHIDRPEYTFDVSLPAESDWGVHIKGPSLQKELAEVRWTVSVETSDDYKVNGTVGTKHVIYEGPMATYYPATGRIGLHGNSFSIWKARNRDQPYRFIIRLKFDRTMSLARRLSLDAAYHPPMP